MLVPVQVQDLVDGPQDGRGRGGRARGDADAASGDEEWGGGRSVRADPASSRWDSLLRSWSALIVRFVHVCCELSIPVAPQTSADSITGLDTVKSAARSIATRVF